MSECKNCDRETCEVASFPHLPDWPGCAEDWFIGWTAVKDNCVAHAVNWRERALAAEKQSAIDADRANMYREKWQVAEAKLSALTESGTGYSQQTVDAIVKERDDLRAALEYEAWKHAACLTIATTSEKAPDPEYRSAAMTAVIELRAELHALRAQLSAQQPTATCWICREPMDGKAGCKSATCGGKK